MATTQSSRWQAMWVLPPLMVGIAILFFMVSSKQPPEQVEQKESIRKVRVVSATTADFTPVVRGYGSVQPEKVWNAIAQVSGRIIQMHPRLRNGEIIPAGSELFRIDPTDYNLALALVKTELAELEVRNSNTRASLEIEQRNLALAEKEFRRQKKLAAQGTVSRSRLDESERATLNSRALVQNLKNTLALIPTQRSLLETRITQAKRNLANTRLSAPFDMRVSGLAIEAHQFVSLGQRLLSGDSVDRVEIIAQVAITDLKNLFIGQSSMTDNIDFINNNLAKITGFKPTVKMDIGGTEVASWDAEFLRISDTVDPQTRTIGIVIAVDKPMQKTIPGIRPPLSKGMFVEVTIAGHSQANRLLIPRSALRGGKVFLVNAQNRLEIRPVTSLYHQQDIAIINNGLSAGETIVVSDLAPAVEGMLLQTEHDLSLQQSLQSGH